MDRIYLKIADLHNVLQIPKSNVKNILESSFKKENYLYLINTYWISYNVLSTADFTPYYLISEIELKSRYFAIFKKAESRNKQLIYLFEALKIATERPPNIDNLLNDLDQRIPVNALALSKTYNAFKFFCELKETTGKECFFLYYHLVQDARNSGDYIYSTSSLDTFKAKMLRFRKMGIQAIIRRHYNNKNASLIFSESELEIIKRRFRHGNLLSYRQTCIEVNMQRVLKGKKRVSVQTIIKTTKNLEDYGKLFIERQGYDGIRNTVFHPRRKECEFPGDQYQADATKFPFPYKNDQGKSSYLYLTAVIDVFSLKIVGFTLTKSEIFAGYLEILKQVILETKKLPAELVIDNHRTLLKPEAKVFFAKMESMGAIIRHCRIGNKEDKAQIENFFNILNMLYSKEKDGYQGENITSRRKECRPNAGKRTESLLVKNLRSKYEVEVLAKTLIDDYNSTYKVKNSVPQLLFANTKMQHSIHLDDDNLLRVLFFQEKLDCLHKAGLRFQVNNQWHEYLLDDENIDFLLEYLEKDIIIRFNPDDMNRIFLYKSNSYKVILELLEHVKIPIAKATHTEIDKENLLKLGLGRKRLEQKLNERVFGQFSKKKLAEKTEGRALIKSEETKLVDRRIQPIKAKSKLQKNTIVEIAKGGEFTTIDPKVLNLKLALARLFKVQGSNNPIN